MIDLTPFVGDRIIESEQWLNQPFNVGNETVATNGHLLIAVPKREGYADSKEGALRVMKYLEQFPADLKPLPEAIPLKVVSGCFIVLLEGTKIHLDQKYLNLIKDLPGLKVAVRPSIMGVDTQLYWKSDESRGVLMGCRR